MLSKKMKIVSIMLWGILSLASLAITIMHPRIHYGFIFIFCFVLFLKSIFARKQFQSKSFWDTTIGGILLIIVLLYVGSPLNILYPYHAPYEYKKDIQELKAETPQRHKHFPDMIPKSATKVEFRCVPSLMQGTHYETLFFHIDESYIGDIIEQYSLGSGIYKYREANCGWIASEDEELTFFPGMSEIPDDEKKNICVIMTLAEENGHGDHYYSGIYYNIEEEYICFFAY